MHITDNKTIKKRDYLNKILEVKSVYSFLL